MDQIFERLEGLFRSWFADDDTEKTAEVHRARSFGDPDVDAAMDELDDFLETDREKAEKRRQERERAEKARANDSRSRDSRQQSGPPAKIVQDYATLGLKFGTPFAEVKAAYKKLLLKHHPDRNNSTPDASKKATEVSAKINMAYHRIEQWIQTGKVPTD